MYEGVIVFFDVVSAVGFAAALVIVLNLRVSILDHVSKTLFALLLGIYVLVGQQTSWSTRPLRPLSTATRTISRSSSPLPLPIFSIPLSSTGSWTGAGRRKKR